jgi:hypothetical protein
MKKLSIEHYETIVILMTQEIASLERDLLAEKQLSRGYHKGEAIAQLRTRELEGSLQQARLVICDMLKGARKKVKQVMKVPNSQYGRDIIHKMKTHLTKGKKIVCRGRNPKDGVKRAVSYRIEDCNEIGIYIEEK